MEIGIKGGSDGDGEGSRVFAGVGEMRKGLSRVPITTQALGESEPGRHTGDDEANGVRHGMRQTYGVGASGGWLRRVNGGSRHRRPDRRRVERRLAYLDFVRNVPAGGADEKVETD